MGKPPSRRAGHGSARTAARGEPPPRRTARGSLRTPALILAADHRARGVLTVEPYARYKEALTKALPHCDGLLASIQPLQDLCASGAVGSEHRVYLSLNRTGLAGSSFELDDRLVTTVGRAVSEGYAGVKHMIRIDLSDAATATSLELLGRVLEEARQARLEAIVEALPWRSGAVARDTESIVMAAVIAHDLGAPLLKVPVPDVTSGAARAAAVARVVASVGVPVLFLGGSRPEEPDGRARKSLLAMVEDVMAGGGGGMALGRGVYQDPDPAEAARLAAGIVHRVTD